MRNGKMRKWQPTEEEESPIAVEVTDGDKSLEKREQYLHII